jgi:hypothetical protein
MSTIEKANVSLEESQSDVQIENQTKLKYYVLGSWRLLIMPKSTISAIYICGIMLYRLGFEAFNGSIVALATAGRQARTFERARLLAGLNQALQCVGSILLAPLIKCFLARTVSFTAILVLRLLTVVPLIVDAGIGGTISVRKSDDFGYYGDYKTNGIPH